MIKKTIILTFGLFSAIGVWAQDDITKQLEVTKAYTPKVGRAAKLTVEPRMVDTVQLRPDIDYRITPTPWQTVFETPKYRPATISVVPFDKNHPFYLRAGAGYPLQSTADLYFNPYIGNRSSFGLYFNHRGSYSKIRNDMDVKLNAAEMLNAAGLYGSKNFRRYRLDGDFAFDSRIYDSYGILVSEDPGSILASGFNFGRARAAVRFGDSFNDMGRFNFEVGLNAGFSYARHNDNQLDIDLWGRIGQMFRSKHGFEVGLSERGAIGVGRMDGYSAVTGTFAPRYILSLPRLSLRAGLDLYYLSDKTHNNNGVRVAPAAEIKYNTQKGFFSPYATLTSRFTDGSFEALSRRNPYMSGVSAPTGMNYDLRVGISGCINGIFSYRVYGGGSILRDYSALYNDFTAGATIATDSRQLATDYPVSFRPLTDDGVMYTAGAELGLDNLSGFSARISANWYSYDFDWLPVADGLPGYDAGVELSYALKDKFRVSAGTTVIGKRGFIDHLATSDTPGDATVINNAGAAADVWLTAEVKALERLWIFAEGRNLANQKLYPYNHYRGLGANVMLGIKTVF